MDPKDKLKQWLADNNLKQAEFADRVEYDKGNFSRMLGSENVWPTLDLAFRIERETGGAIQMSEWAQAKAA